MLRRLFGIAVIGVLTACGGGGGGGGGSFGGGVRDETLTVSISYSSVPIPLWHRVVVSAQASGFGGLSPNCTFVNGELPPGMELRSDCSVAGRPTRAGVFGFLVRVGASGASNTVDMSGSIHVQGPQFWYHDNGFGRAVTVSDSISVTPSILNWTPPADVPITVSFALHDGALAPGMSLDPDTGVISGVPQTRGEYRVSVRPRIESVYGVHESPPANYTMYVDDLRFGYPSVFEAYRSVYIGRAFSLAPDLYADWTYTDVRLTGNPLPPGLSLDAATGTIAGTPAGPEQPAADYLFDATAVRNGVTTTAKSGIRLAVRRPVEIRYAPVQLELDRNAPMLHRPTVTQLTTPSGDTSYSAVLYVGDSCPPPGISMDASGVFSGTPTTAGSYGCTVEFTIHDNGFTWTASAFMGFYVR